MRRRALLLLAAAVQVGADLLCSSPLSLQHTVLAPFSTSNTSTAISFPVGLDGVSSLPGLAIAGSGVGLVVENATHVMAAVSINYGNTFQNSFVLGPKSGGAVNVQSLGIVTDGSRFEIVGSIGARFASYSLVDTALVFNSSNNQTYMYTILAVLPAVHKLAAKTGLFLVAADGGSLSQLSVYTRSSQSVTAQWVNTACPRCPHSSSPPALATDGTAFLMCAVNGVNVTTLVRLRLDTSLSCYLSPNGTSAFVPTAYSPMANITGELALASSAGSTGFYVAAFNNGQGIVQSSYTLDAGATAWSTPIVVYNGTVSAPQLIALAQNQFVAMYNTTAGTGVVGVSALPYVSQTWQSQAGYFSGAFQLASAGFQDSLGLAYFVSAQVPAVDMCINPAVVTDPPTLSPTPSAAALPPSSSSPLLASLAIATLVARLL